jgi:hypothetical protein
MRVFIQMCHSQVVLLRVQLQLVRHVRQEKDQGHGSRGRGQGRAEQAGAVLRAHDKGRTSALV